MAYQRNIVLAVAMITIFTICISTIVEGRSVAPVESESSVSSVVPPLEGFAVSQLEGLHEGNGPKPKTKFLFPFPPFGFDIETTYYDYYYY